MKFSSHIIIAATLTLLLARTSLAEVKTDYDRNANFSQYKTYSWQNVSTRDPLMVDRIKSAVNAALAVKGWTEVPSGGDASIMAMEMTKDRRTLKTYYDNFEGGWGWRWGGGFGDNFGTAITTEETYKVGTLVVDLFDTGSKKLIWRGSETDMLSINSAKNIRELDKNVKKMFDHFPPHAKQ